MIESMKSRRDFMKGALAAGAAAATLSAPRAALAGLEYTIGIDGWSFHKEVFTGKIKQIDLFKVVRDEYGIGVFNLVNNMLEVTTSDYLNRLGQAAKKSDVKIPLIMIDSEGPLGHPDKETRDKAVRNHTKWVWAAADLGCQTIRVNWAGGEAGAQRDEAKGKALIERSAESFGALVEVGKQNGINIIIENHGGASSYPALLVGLMKAVNSPFFGTLPDFGNFPADVDKYDAIDQLMPYAKAVSAKCHDFADDTGLETKIDFPKMMQIVCVKHGFKGNVGIEFEGSRLSEREGVKRCQALLEKIKAA